MLATALHGAGVNDDASADVVAGFCTWPTPADKHAFDCMYLGAACRNAGRGQQPRGAGLGRAAVAARLQQRQRTKTTGCSKPITIEATMLDPASIKNFLLRSQVTTWTTNAAVTAIPCTGQ